MAESFIQVPPNSTGLKSRTRQRVIGANTIEESYVISQSERVLVARTMMATFRTPARAVASQPLFVLWNGGTGLVAVRRLSLEVDSIAASIVASSYARTYRISAAPTGGTAVPKIQQDTNETSAVGVAATGDASADNTSSTTALAATANPVTPAWAQIIPRWQTLAGYQALPVLNMIPDDGNLNAEEPLTLRASQGVLIRLESPAALTAGAYTFHIKCAFDEYTLP